MTNCNALPLTCVGQINSPWHFLTDKLNTVLQTEASLPSASEKRRLAVPTYNVVASAGAKCRFTEKL